jgi:hypothetical protein
MSEQTAKIKFKLGLAAGQLILMMEKNKEEMSNLQGIAKSAGFIINEITGEVTERD